jgi:hypothetical protein
MPQSNFAANSRYYNSAVRKLKLADGDEVAYLARREIPDPESLATIGELDVLAGDRPDLMGFRAIGDPEQWWKIADANAVLDPAELTENVGGTVRITLPEGIVNNGEDTFA